MEVSYESGGIGAAIVLIAGILYKIYTVVNHKHLRSRCCGKEFDAAIDIDDSTPKNPEVVSETVK
jgi:hypothetical protein